MPGRARSAVSVMRLLRLCSVLFGCVLLFPVDGRCFYSTPSVLFCSVLFCSDLMCSVRFFRSAVCLVERVLRLDVLVHHAVVVHVRQRARELRRDGRRLRDRAGDGSYTLVLRDEIHVATRHHSPARSRRLRSWPCRRRCRWQSPGQDSGRSARGPVLYLVVGWVPKRSGDGAVALSQWP